MKQAGASVKVAKNRLARSLWKGSDVASIAPLLKGPARPPSRAIQWRHPRWRSISPGPTSVSSFLVATGTTALDPNGVKALAALPSLDELRAKIVGLIQAPATKIAQIVNAPAAKVARVVQAYASKSGEDAAA